MMKLKSIKNDISELKERDINKAKFNAKVAMRNLAAILADLEKDDGTIIDTRGIDVDVINVIAYISALNTLNGYEP